MTALLENPVAPGGQVNVLAVPFTVTQQWQEIHSRAATDVYSGPTLEDRQVVEHRDDEGNLIAKERLHLCFLERAAATLNVRVPDDEAHYARWQILAADDTVIKEHPNFSATNFDNDAAAARLSTGRQGWMWDGRNNATDPVLVAHGRYRSRVTVKDSDGDQVHESEAAIEVEGSPYQIFIVGRPKTDAELLADFGRQDLANRFLSTTGQRTARDCWIEAWRGQQDDGHIVFLGQGTIEATRLRAVATPHGRDYKGWIRANPHGAAANADRIQIEDVGVTNQRIALTNPGGPVPANPDSVPANRPYKVGVQAHGGRTVWTADGLSVGCTTVSRITGATLAQPGSVHGTVRSMNSMFGVWGTGEAGQNVAVDGGPDFKNKQNKRNHTEDALIADDHGAPELDPPEHPVPAEGPPAADEPLHMQRTLQVGAFGGFHDHEIPRGSGVADQPVNQLRIRVRLEAAPAVSRYRQYHRALVFGHSWEQIANSYRLTVWIPRKVIRGWNGNFKNVLVRGRCEISWYIDRQPVFGQMGPLPPEAGLNPTGNQTGNMTALPGGYIGRARATWTPTTQPLGPGRYVSVFNYRLRLDPYVAGADVWVAEAAANDLFVTPGANGGAALAAETLVTEGGNQYIQGSSTLEIVTVPL